MQVWLALSLLLIALIFVTIGFCKPLFVNTTNQPSEEGPDSGVVSPHPDVNGETFCCLTEYEDPPDDSNGPLTEDERALLQEDFRISRGGGGGGSRRGGGGGGGGGRPWRRWPRNHYRRPWRSWPWRSYPEVVYTYPLTYYTPVWTPPVQRFSVRIGPKADNNPFAGEGSDYGYMITQGSGTGCGASGARLDLNYGQTYEFDVYTSKDCVTGRNQDEPFFFTTDRNGGSANGALFAITPTVNGTIRITITDNLPNHFYYQSTNNRNVGGHVFLH